MPDIQKKLLEEYHTELCGKGRDEGRCAIANSSFSAQRQFTSFTGCFDCSTKDKKWTWYKVCADLTACCYQYNYNLLFNTCFPTQAAFTRLNHNALSGIKVESVSILEGYFLLAYKRTHFWKHLHSKDYICSTTVLLYTSPTTTSTSRYVTSYISTTSAHAVAVGYPENGISDDAEKPDRGHGMWTTIVRMTSAWKVRQRRG